MATTYRVESSADGLTGWTTQASGLTSPIANLTGQPINTTYFYRIIVVVDGVDTAISEVWRNLNLSIPVLTATGGLNRSFIALTWPSVSATKYRVYKFINYNWILQTETTNLFWNDFTLAGNVYYSYYVSAVSADGYETDPSNIATAKIWNGGIFMSVATSRASVYQGLQIGKESTAGVIVPATVRIPGFEFAPEPDHPRKVVHVQGAKGAIGTQAAQKMTNGKLSGPLDFNLLTYCCESAFGTVSPVTANLGSTRLYTPDSIQPLVPQTYSLEQGSSKGAEKWGFGLITGFTIRTSKSDATLEADIICQKTQRDAVITPNVKVVLTAAAAGAATTLAVSALSGAIPSGTILRFMTGKVAVTSALASAAATSITVTALAVGIAAGDVAFLIPEIASVPVDPMSVGIYFSFDGLTSWTKLLDPIETEMSFGGLYKPSFHQNDANESFDRITEQDPSFSGMFTTEEGTEADQYMASLEAGTKMYLGIKALGPVINASPLVQYLMQLRMPVYITKPGPKNIDGVWGNAFSVELAHDAGYGLCNVTTVNPYALMP